MENVHPQLRIKPVQLIKISLQTIQGFIFLTDKLISVTCYYFGNKRAEFPSFRRKPESIEKAGCRIRSGMTNLVVFTCRCNNEQPNSWLSGILKLKDILENFSSDSSPFHLPSAFPSRSSSQRSGHPTSLVRRFFLSFQKRRHRRFFDAQFFHARYQCC
jgi:hypothetical protein